MSKESCVNQVLEVTDKAVEQMRNIVASENKGSEFGIRVGVVGGGCSGLSYKIEFSQQKEKDNIVNFEGVKLLIDPKSSIYLKGTILDFQDGLNGKGFVFNNPNAKNSCGCGESFSV